VSGKGAAPFTAAWLVEGTNGELPGQLMQNLLLAGRVDDKSDSELQDLWTAGLTSVKERNGPQRNNATSLQVSIQLTEAADSNFQSTRAALNSAVDPRGELGLIEKFSPELLDPPTPRVLELQQELQDYQALEAAHAAAVAANPTLVSLRAQLAATFAVLRRYDDTNPVEVAAHEASRELVRRGVKKVRVP
jgi:hypothetical protein